MDEYLPDKFNRLCTDGEGRKGEEGEARSIGFINIDGSPGYSWRICNPSSIRKLGHLLQYKRSTGSERSLPTDNEKHEGGGFSFFWNKNALVDDARRYTRIRACDVIISE